MYNTMFYMKLVLLVHLFTRLEGLAMVSVEDESGQKLDLTDLFLIFTNMKARKLSLPQAKTRTLHFCMFKSAGLDMYKVYN